MSGPTVGPDGTIYVASGTRSVWALTGDGAVKWTSAMATPLVAPVTYQGGASPSPLPNKARSHPRRRGGATSQKSSLILAPRFEGMSR
mmetsp:Transcript_39737/g.105943  ORF Transcript_39737/g.105943 Transcript_39737/m.105943 type:complete len:88 (-) Transcript_39737:24-287(-)